MGLTPSQLSEIRAYVDAATAEKGIHTIRAATRDVGDGTCRFIFGITEDILPEVARIRTDAVTLLDEVERLREEKRKELVTLDWCVKEIQAFRAEVERLRTALLEIQGVALHTEKEGGKFGANWCQDQCRYFVDIARKALEGK